VQSVLTIPGADFLAMNQGVPHGSVETVWYPSKTLGKMRRMHVYLPPVMRRAASAIRPSI